MPALTRNFEIFRSKIEPDTDAKEKAQTIPATIRDYLAKHPDFETDYPHTLLAGSYARNTATKAIKDIDILLFESQSMRDMPIADMMDCLHKTLKDLPTVLGNGEVCVLRRQRRSINVNLSSGLQVDIVPVFAKDGYSQILEIPDREWDEYVLTHPLGYASVLSDLNAKHGGKLVPLIKMVKHWRDHKFVLMKPKSYWLESLVVQHYKNGWLTSDGKGDGQLVADFFDAVYEKFRPLIEEDEKAEDTPRIPDGALTNPVAWNWKRSHFESFMNRLKDARYWSSRAVDEEDADEAVTCWQNVFGADWFPDMAKANESLSKAGAATLAGTMAVAQSGRVTMERPKQTPAVIAPSTRFYGD